MSTRIAGDLEGVFGALRQAFGQAAGRHDIVLILKLSNCCPEIDRDGLSGAATPGTTELHAPRRQG
jgi:hypothetical protein